MRFILILCGMLFLQACTTLLPPVSGKPNPPLKAPGGARSGNTPAPVPAENLTINFTVNTDRTQPVNTKIFGFNTGFMFGGNIEDLPEVQRLSKSLSPVTLRFPGGTIANYYHPDLPGYGFKEEEMGTMKDFEGYLKAQPFEKANYLENFAQIAKLTNSGVMFVANLLTGTIEENIKTIDRMQALGLKIVGIELGNEFLLQRYRGQFPDPQTYISKAKTYAAAFRKKYPN
ncbi:MAG TPA: hypothetical protein VEB42_06850, partial [Chitinophagaceae bacterium]|nr:hypothetical protein [Chitinophagaceae bacterium]